MNAGMFQHALELLRAGQLSEAEQLCRKLLAAAPNDTRAMILCAQVVAQQGDAGRGIEMLKNALRIAPDLVPALNGVAALSLKLGDLEGAEAACRHSLAVAPANPVTHFNLGQIFDAAGRHADAVAAYNRALALNPNLSGAYSAIAVALHKLGRLDDAMAAYRRVPAGDPACHIAQFNLGMMHQERDELAEAAASFRRSIAIRPDQTAARLQLGNVLYAMKNFPEATDAYRQLIARNSHMADAHGNLAKSLWAQGDLAGALAACENCLRERPGDTAAIAFMAVLLRENGDEAGARSLVDFDRFIRTMRIAAPAGFGDLSAFNDAIATFACRHPTLVQEPRNNATKDGKHTADLLAGPKGPLAALEQEIERAVSTYLRELPDDVSHPFVANRPERWKLTAWAVVMAGQGYQLPHIHPQAWLSGVYYVRIPPAISASTADQAGWIEFGEPLPEFGCKARQDLWLFRPEEGTMLLFPSYFYHRTLPFHGSDTRISLAFDAIGLS